MVEDDTTTITKHTPLTKNKTEINPLGPDGNTRTAKTSYLSLSNIIMMSQLTKWEENANFLGETLGSAVLDSGAFGTVWGTKWYECFLETLTDTQRKKKIVKGVRTLKFSDGNKLNSLYKVTLPCVIADIEVSIITDVVDADIPLI